MDNTDIIIDDSIQVISQIKDYKIKINKIIDLIINSINNDGKIIIFGNGGSAADSQHFAAELVGRFMLERKSLPAISLTTDTSIITAIGNDYQYEEIFSRQCQSLVKTNDIVIGISTSGNSKNIIKGLEVSKKIGAITMGLLGNDGGNIKEIVDYSLIIKSNSTPRIQEAHRVILHIICEIVEKKMFTGN